MTRRRRLLGRTLVAMGIAVFISEVIISNVTYNMITSVIIVNLGVVSFSAGFLILNNKKPPLL